MLNVVRTSHTGLVSVLNECCKDKQYRTCIGTECCKDKPYRTSISAE